MREKGSLAGAAAIVTGASSGIGYAIASRLAVDGAAVAINYHSQREPAEQLRGEIERSGGVRRRCGLRNRAQ
jgi:glucose 1-dehydrogenase